MRDFILVLVLVVAFAGVTAAQQPTMEEIVKKWDARRAAIKCVKYEVEETCTVLKDRIQEMLDARSKQVLKSGRPDNYQLNSKHTLILDFQSGRFRWDTDGQEWGLTEKSIIPLRGGRAFSHDKHKSVRWPNSGETRVGVELGRSSDFAEVTGNLQGQSFPRFLWPLFYEHGIVPLLLDHQLYPGQWHKYQPSEFADAVVLTGGTTLTLPPNKNSQLPVTGQLALTDSLDGRVRSFRLSRNGKLSESIEITRRKLASGDALSWTYKRHNQLGDVITDQQVKVIAVDLAYQPDLTDFDLSPSSGMVLRKIQVPAPTQEGVETPTKQAYRVEPTGDLSPILPRNAPVGRPWRAFVSVCCLLLLAGFVARHRIHRLPKGGVAA